MLETLYPRAIHLQRTLDNFANCELISREGAAIRSVHVISRKRLLEAATKHPGLGDSLDAWYRIAKKAVWTNLEEVRATFPKTDRVGKQTVFNIKGNAFRLIAEISYAGQRIYIRSVLTHAQYDKGEWK